MTHLESSEMDALKRIKTFGETHAADFPAESLGAQQFAVVAAAGEQP